METTEMIVTALAFGGQQIASEAIKDAYNKVKGLVRNRFAGDVQAETALAAYEDDTETWVAPLRKSLERVGAVHDAEIIEAAQQLMTLANSQQTAVGKYNVQIKGNAQGVVQGDNAKVTMNFGDSLGKD